MSQEIREKALAAAIQVENGKGGMNAEVIIVAAKIFESYIAGHNTSKVANEPDAPAPKKVGRPAKAAEAEVVVPKKAASDPIADMKKVVGDKVNELLKANKRSEAVELLASFNGAKSATGVIEQGEEVVQAFLVGADAILMAE